MSPAPRHGVAAARVRVLHLIHHLEIGGAETMLAELLPRLNAARFEVEAACLGGAGPRAAALEAAGIPVWSVGKRPGFDLRAVWRLARELRRRRVRILNTHSFSAGCWGRVAGVLARTPIVVTTVHTVAGWANPGKHRLVNRLLAPAARRIVAVSECVRTSLIAQQGLAPHKIVVIHNGVDAERFAPGLDGTAARAEAHVAPGEALLVMIGRCSVEKGGPHFLAAIRLLAARRPVRAVVVGEGPQRAAWESLAVLLGVQDRVAFVGARLNPEHWIAAADAVVCPSLQESFGLVAVEAQACGKPVVASRIDGLQEVIVDGETGLLVPPGDPAALAAAMERLLDAPELGHRLGQAGIHHVRARFPIEATARAYETLYDQLLAPPSLDGFMARFP